MVSFCAKMHCNMLVTLVVVLKSLHVWKLSCSYIYHKVGRLQGVKRNVGSKFAMFLEKNFIVMNGSSVHFFGLLIPVHFCCALTLNSFQPIILLLGYLFDLGV